MIHWRTSPLKAMYYYIINPVAGRGSINNVQDKLRARLKELGIAGEFAKTTGAGDATRMAQTAIKKGFSTIVAVGGDDTVNEIVNAVTGEAAAIGIIPTGSSNTIAARLGVTNWQQSCEVLSARRLVEFSLIAAGQKFFLSTLSLGFETHLDKHIDTETAGLRARGSQFWKSLGHATSFEPLSCDIKIDKDLELSCQVFSLSIANQRFYNPAAEDKLVVSISDKPSRAALTPYLWRLMRRSEALDDATTTRFVAERLLIQTDPVTGLTIDGKVAGRTPVAIRLTDQKIRFICEKPSTGFKA